MFKKIKEYKKLKQRLKQLKINNDIKEQELREIELKKREKQVNKIKEEINKEKNDKKYEEYLNKKYS